MIGAAAGGIPTDGILVGKPVGRSTGTAACFCGIPAGSFSRSRWSASVSEDANGHSVSSLVIGSRNGSGRTAVGGTGTGDDAGFESGSGLSLGATGGGTGMAACSSSMFRLAPGLRTGGATGAADWGPVPTPGWVIWERDLSTASERDFGSTPFADKGVGSDFWSASFTSEILKSSEKSYSRDEPVPCCTSSSPSMGMMTV